MNKVAIIVAAGNGSRMNSDIPKQFLLINDRPVLYYTLRAFLDAYDDLKVILVLSQMHIEKGREIIDGFFNKQRITICEGGETRFDSVRNGLHLVEDESVIFVHDGVRCLVSVELIKRCYEKALDFGNAIPAIRSKDSVRIVENDENYAIARDTIMMVQTPQTFHSKIIIPAYNIDFKEHFTDEASVVEAFGLKINLVDGEETNIKITTPLDFKLAEFLLKNQRLFLNT